MTTRQKTQEKTVQFAHKAEGVFTTFTGKSLSQKAICGCKNKLQIADKRHKKHQKRLKKRKNKRKTAILQILCNLTVAATDKAQKRRKTPHFRPKMPEKCKKRTARQKCSEKSAVLPSAKPFRAGKPCPALLDFAALI